MFKKLLLGVLFSQMAQAQMIDYYRTESAMKKNGKAQEVISNAAKTLAESIVNKNACPRLRPEERQILAIAMDVAYMQQTVWHRNKEVLDVWIQTMEQESQGRIHLQINNHSRSNMPLFDVVDDSNNYLFIISLDGSGINCKQRGN